ncbi:MAG: prepilin peptidase [Patescibacteria group bacterium]|nr:prepilin peptidase [Patescibacteria group bacterium]
MIIVWTILAAVLGVIVGSFVNVVVFRTKTDEAFWKGRSKCRTCEVPISPIDLVPVLSYFALKGRCRSCSATIEWQYPAVELITGVMFGVLFARAALGIGVPDWIDGSEWLALFVRDAVMSVFLLIIFVYDFKYSYILDRFSIPAIILAIVFNLALGADAINLLLGGLFIGGFFAFQFLVSSGKWVGGGDIRMGMLMGFLLGVSNGVLALFLSYILGAIFGIILILTKKRKLDSQVPFGTFMAAATLITMILGPYMLEWYLGFFS